MVIKYRNKIINLVLQPVQIFPGMGGHDLSPGWADSDPPLAKTLANFEIQILTLAILSWGSSNVSLFLLRLLICSTTKLKYSEAWMQSLDCKELTTSWTVVQVSYLKLLVCPFSRKTLRTLAIWGTQMSPMENAEG